MVEHRIRSCEKSSANGVSVYFCCRRIKIIIKLVWAPIHFQENRNSRQKFWRWRKRISAKYRIINTETSRIWSGSSRNASSEIFYWEWTIELDKTTRAIISHQLNYWRNESYHENRYQFVIFVTVSLWQCNWDKTNMKWNALIRFENFARCGVAWNFRLPHENAEFNWIINTAAMKWITWSDSLHCRARVVKYKLHN